jgi:two-component system, OmpR family, aerobic respiration control sensor histidine kinase ArcB
MTTFNEHKIFTLLEEIAELFYELPANIYWKNRAGQYLGANLCQLQIWGTTSIKDIYGKTAYELADKDIADAICANDEKVMQSGIAYSVEEDGPAPLGTKSRYFSKKIPLKNDKQEVVGLLGVSFDIAKFKAREDDLLKKQQETELYLTNVLALMPSHIYWMDKDGRILGCNDQQAQSFGLKNAEELKGKNIFDVAKILGWNQSIPLAIRANDLEIMGDGQRTLTEEKVVLNGEERIFLAHKAPLLDRNGKVIGIIGNAIDITERKKIEQELKEAKENLETANRLKDEFIADLEHDLRTPLAGISGIVNMLLSEEPDQKKQELLGYIAKSCNRFLDYCGEILDANRFVALMLNAVPVREDFDLREVLENIITTEMPAIISKHIKLEVLYSQELPSEFRGDSKGILRVLLNLVGNAIKFTEQGKVIIKVGIQEKDDTNVVLSLSVADTGIGISEEQQKFIFEKYYRAERSNRGRKTGSGLGLYVVKEFLHKIGGTINVKSVLGQGSEFTCLLPLQLAKIKT